VKTFVGESFWIPGGESNETACSQRNEEKGRAKAGEFLNLGCGCGGPTVKKKGISIRSGSAPVHRRKERTKSPNHWGLESSHKLGWPDKWF